MHYHTLIYLWPIRRAFFNPIKTGHLVPLTYSKTFGRFDEIWQIPIRPVHPMRIVNIRQELPSFI